MAETLKELKSISREEFTIPYAGTAEWEVLRIGALLRIADALESLQANSFLCYKDGRKIETLTRKVKSFEKDIQAIVKQISPNVEMTKGK